MCGGETETVHIHPELIEEWYDLKPGMTNREGDIPEGFYRHPYFCERLLPCKFLGNRLLRIRATLDYPAPGSGGLRWPIDLDNVESCQSYLFRKRAYISSRE